VDLSQSLVEAGDTFEVAGNFELAEAKYAAAARAASSHAARSLAWQRLASNLLTLSFTQESASSTSLLHRALAAADAALTERPSNALAWMSKAAVLGRLGEQRTACQLLGGLLGVEDKQTYMNAAAFHGHPMKLHRSVELQARALFVRIGVTGGASPAEVISQTKPLLQLMVPDDSDDDAGFALWSGPLGLEMAFLACTARVEMLLALPAGARPEVELSISSGPGLEAPECITEVIDRVLHDLTAEESELIDETPNFDMTTLPEPHGWPPSGADHSEDCSLRHHELVAHLTWVAHTADAKGYFDLLWQALAWRCRVQVLQQNWCQAISDATKALRLNAFAAAEIFGPHFNDNACKEIPVGLDSQWSCLRMRAAALHQKGLLKEAKADAELLRQLLIIPPATHLTKTAPLEDSKSRDSSWRRTSEQIAALRRRKNIRKDRTFSLPEGF